MAWVCEDEKKYPTLIHIKNTYREYNIILNAR